MDFDGYQSTFIEIHIFGRETGGNPCAFRWPILTPSGGVLRLRDEVDIGLHRCERADLIGNTRQRHGTQDTDHEGYSSLLHLRNKETTLGDRGGG